MSASLHKPHAPRVALLTSLVFAGLLTACGGGGSDGGSTTTPPPIGGETPNTPPVTPSTPTFKTYQNTTLPGRLVVNSPLGDATVLNLQTGGTSPLPASGIKATNSADGDQWQSTAASAVLLRFNSTQLAGDGAPNVRVSVYDGVSSTTASVSWKVSGRIHGTPLVSPDGKQALAFYSATPGADPRLSVWDMQSGNMLKQGSVLDGEIIMDTPAAWLPDGRYVYLAGNRLVASSATASSDTELARLTGLPSNNAANWQGYVSGQSTLAISPNGKRVAFSWSEQRGVSIDKHIWVANIDGTALHRLTKVSDADSPLDFRFLSPSWSPDSLWVVALLDMHATATQPLFPGTLYDEIPAPLTVSGTTGCSNSQVLVFSATADQETISWPTLDASHGVKSKTTAGLPAWLTSCSPVSWTQ